MTKYGYTTIGVVSIIVFVMLLISFFVNSNYVKVPLITLSILLMAFTLNFFRDPDRNSPNIETAVVSPADGTVIVIKEVYEDKFIKDKAWQISIFMSPLNVHVNRIPVSGEVKYLQYVEGDYLVASHDKASEQNERSETGIESKHGKVFFTQVAGYVARRIINDLKIDQPVTQGERYGMIKFGSRVDVIVPLNSKIKVEDGSVVKAGETILFEFGNQ